MIVPGYLSAKSLRETDPATGEHRVWFSHAALEGRLADIARLERALAWKGADAAVEKRVLCLLQDAPGKSLVIRFSRLLGDALGRPHDRVEAFLADEGLARSVCRGTLSLDGRVETAEFDLTAEDRDGPQVEGEPLVLENIEFEFFGDRTDCLFGGARKTERTALANAPTASEKSSWRGFLIFILVLATILSVGTALNLAYELTLVERSLEATRKELFELRRQVNDEMPSGRKATNYDIIHPNIN